MWHNFVNGTPMARQGLLDWHFIYRKTAQKQKTGGKMSKNLSKGVFFPTPPTSWMSLAETVLAQFKLWLKLSWHSFSLAATVAAQFQAETLPNTV